MTSIWTALALLLAAHTPRGIPLEGPGACRRFGPAPGAHSFLQPTSLGRRAAFPRRIHALAMSRRAPSEPLRNGISHIGSSSGRLVAPVGLQSSSQAVGPGTSAFVPWRPSARLALPPRPSWLAWPVLADATEARDPAEFLLELLSHLLFPSRDPSPGQSRQACEFALASEGFPFRSGPPTDGIAWPVTPLEWCFGGVCWIHHYPDQRDSPLDCRLALALSRASRILAALGVSQVVWSSAYRPPSGDGKPNKHTRGLAVDVHAFVFRDGIRAVVAADYERGLGFQEDDSCLGWPTTRRAALLRLVACRLDEAELFQELITPDYDRGHWNHFHLAAPASQEAIRPRHTALLEVPVTRIPGWALRRHRLVAEGADTWRRVIEEPWPKRLAVLKPQGRKSRRLAGLSALLLQVLERIGGTWMPGHVRSAPQELH